MSWGDGEGGREGSDLSTHPPTPTPNPITARLSDSGAKLLHPLSIAILASLALFSHVLSPSSLIRLWKFGGLREKPNRETGPSRRADDSYGQSLEGLEAILLESLSQGLHRS